MARYKPYDYSQRVLLPVSLEDQLMPGTLEFAIHTLVENRMDISIFDQRHKNDETGCPAYDPKILLKVVLLAYSRGIVSSRKIERACREQVIFMALSCRQCPDHSTIAEFVSTMKEEILSLFRDVLLVCEEMKLLGGTLFALDGCKLSSNASSRWSGTFSELKKKKEKIEGKIRRLLEEQIQTDRQSGDKDDDLPEPDRAKQIERLTKQATRIENWLKENHPKIGLTGKEIKSNITDNESAKMSTSHGTIKGYNGQALVDSKHQVIVHGDAFGCGTDHDLLPPVLDGAKDNMKACGHDEDYFEGKISTADTSYHSQTNLSRCEEDKLDAYIPDRDFRKRDPRFASKKCNQHRPRKKFSRKDFQYDSSSDHYVCPGGNILRLKVKRWVSKGTIYKRYVAQEASCQSCPLKAKCMWGRGGKCKHLMVPIGGEATNLTKKMVEKIDSERGRKIYPLRIATVEPVFAHIRTHKGLDRFTVRGKIKVTIQWLLYCMVHNTQKIANYGQAC